MARATINAAFGGWIALVALGFGAGTALAQAVGAASGGADTAAGAANGAGPGGAGPASVSGPASGAASGALSAAGSAASNVAGAASAVAGAVTGAVSGAVSGAVAGAVSGPAGPLSAPEMAATASRPPVQSPIVVELFTSQGCSACPPADALMAKIAPRTDIIALALHVDYWDYLGWEDPFAQPAFTARQKAYARAKGERMIYTPQMIVGGAEALVAPEAPALEAAVAKAAAAPSPVGIQVSGGAGQYQIELWANPPLTEGTVVQIVRYAPQARVEILRGENAGLELDYANVVTAWHAVAEWDGTAPTRLNAKIEGEQPAVVIVQRAHPGKSVPLPGAILAAARLQ